jgi:glyoxylase-like metal-dependent hydrolase (beta-lactamase superfamily II)
MQTFLSKIHISVDGSIIQEKNGLVVIDAGCERRSLDDFLFFSKKTKLPLKYVFLTHFHWDHVANLKFLRNHFKNITIIAHSQNPKAHLNQPTLQVEGMKEFRIGGTSYLTFPTPGHSEKKDDICIYLPRERVLFSGDMVQPQGKTYETCNFVTPLPYFEHGDDYISSLRELLNYRIISVITAHGKKLPYSSISITLKTVERINEIAREEVAGCLANPSNSKINKNRICRNIFIRIADERNFPYVKERLKEDYYKQLDRHGLMYFVNKYLS